MTTIEDIIVNPRRSQGYISFDCPGCGKKNKAFKYDNSPVAKCNRGSCDWTFNFAELEKNKKLPTFTYKSNTDVEKDNSIDRTNRVSCALGHSAGSVDRYIQMRVLRHIPEVCMQDLLDQKFFGLSSMVRESKAHKWDRADYRLFTPLYCMGTNKILSGQHRYTGLGPPPENKDGSRLPKNVSMRGGYGRFGVTFGSLRDAIKEAGKMESPKVYVTEGDMDFITMRSMGFKSCVGVPGAGQAKKVIEQLMTKGWVGEVVLCLDQDEAGRKATEQAIFYAITNCGDKIFVSDASPGQEKYDITDSLANFGLEFTRRMIINSRQRASISEQKVKIFETEHCQRLRSIGIVAPRSPIQKIHKERTLNTIETTGGKNSPIYKFRKLSHCGSVAECEISYGEDGVKVNKNVYKRCRSKWCDHCRVTQWNYGITQKILESWPEMLCIGVYEFDNLEDLKRIKKSIFSMLQIPSDLGQSGGLDRLHSHANIYDKNLIIVADPEQLSSIGLRSICPIAMHRDTILREYLLPAYLSPIKYFKEKVEDPDWLLHQDEFLCNKAKLYHSRPGLPWPKQEEIRETVASFFEELYAEDGSEGGAEETNILVSYSKNSEGMTKILSVSERSFSFNTISKSMLFDSKLETNPQDPTINYLQEPHLCPVKIEDVIKDFIELTMRVPVDKAQFEMHTPWSGSGSSESVAEVRFSDMSRNERRRYWSTRKDE